MNAASDMGALGPNPSNAEIYPIENRQLLGFGLGVLLSISAMIAMYFAGRRKVQTPRLTSKKK